MTAACPVCQAQQDAGLLCSACCTLFERDLADVPALVAELDVTMSKQARIGNAGSPGLARERTPINVGAMQAADVLLDTLTPWARDLQPHSGPLSHAAAAHILLTHVPAIRRHPSVADLVDEITDAIRQARRAVDRPAERQYLGQCMVETPDDQGRQVTCLAELYARHGASTATCPTCGITHVVEERRDAMLERARDMILTVKEASFLLGEVGGIKVSQASIRGYLHRGKLAYRPGVARGIRLGDLLTVVLEESERKSA